MEHLFKPCSSQHQQVMNFDSGKRQFREFVRSLQKIRLRFPRKSENHMGGNFDSVRMKARHGIGDRIEMVSAVDTVQRFIIGGLHAEFNPDVILFRQFRNHFNRFRRQAVGTRGDDDRVERRQRKRAAVDFPQLFRRSIC